MASFESDRGESRSILKELVVNQYQAIVLGGAAVASLVTLNPIPLLVWFGGQLVLLPLLDSQPVRRLLMRRHRTRARAEAETRRAWLVNSLDAAHRQRYQALEHLCQLIAVNYHSLHGISQAYLSEQREKLNVILDGCAHRMLALERYAALLANREPRKVEQAITRLEHELVDEQLTPRARAALEKNLELKRRLLHSLAESDGTIKTLETELDSMASLLDVLHQSSISMRDPQTVASELDTIVKQAEDSDRVVREMESLLRSDGDPMTVPPLPDEVIPPPIPDHPRVNSARRKAKER